MARTIIHYFHLSPQRLDRDHRLAGRSAQSSIARWLALFVATPDMAGSGTLAALRRCVDDKDHFGRPHFDRVKRRAV